jgi:hypothetical protein
MDIINMKVVAHNRIGTILKCVISHIAIIVPTDGSGIIWVKPDDYRFDDRLLSAMI